MKTSFSLLAALTPAVPGGEILPPAPNHSPDPLAASDSFFTVMSQVRGDGFPRSSEESKTAAAPVSLTETAPAPASPPDNEAATLIALMVRSHFGGEQPGAPASAPAVNFKNTPGHQAAPQAPAKPSSSGAPATRTPTSSAILQDKTRPAQTTQPPIAFKELRKPAPAAQAGKILTRKTSANTGASTVVSLKNAAAPAPNVNTNSFFIGEKVEAPSVARSSGSVAPATETAERSAAPIHTAPLPVAAQPQPPFVAGPKPAPDREALASSSNDSSAAHMHQTMAVQPQTVAAELRRPASAPSVNPKITRAANEGGKSPSVQPRVATGELPQPARAQTVNPKVAPAAPETPAPLLAESSSSGKPVPIQPQVPTGELRQPALVQTVNPKVAPVTPEIPAPVLTKSSNGDRPASIQPQAAPVNAKIAPDGQKGADQSFTKSSGDDRPVFLEPQVAKVQVIIAPDTARSPQSPIVDIAATASSSSDAPLPAAPKPIAAAPITPVGIDPSIAGTLAAVADQPVPAAGPLRPPAPAPTVNIKIDASLTPAPKTVAAPQGKPVPQTKATEESHDSAAAQPANAKIAPENNAPPAAAHPSSDSKPESAGLAQKAVDPVPEEKPAFTKNDRAGSPPQPAVPPIAVTAPAWPNPAVSVDGTGGALNSQRMSFTGEKNEIAGPAVQKVPGASVPDDFGPKALNELAGGSNSDHSGQRQNSPDPTPLMDWPGKAGEFNVDAAKGTAAVAPADHAATMAERVGHLVDQQVMMLRQSGANNVAVSLKVDPRTELSLQLTNHNGQIEASVRWERGAVAGLDSHWRDLQESLARQNVQLLPLENKPVSRPPSFNSQSGTESGSSSRQSPQNPRRQNAETWQDAPLAGDAQTVAATKQSTARTASRQGWESWA